MLDCCSTAERAGATRHRCILAAIGVLAALVLVLLPGQGTALALDPEGCLICHGDPNFQDPTPPVEGEERSLFVDPQKFSSSVHGGKACQDCHKGFLLTIPQHQKDESKDFRQVAIEACEGCHQKEFMEYQTSDHARRFYADHDKGPICISCHGSHEIRKVNLGKETADFKMSMAEDSCGREGCHPDKFAEAKHEFHFKALSLGYERAATCFDCHGFHENLALKSGEEETVEQCRQCHPGANAGFTYFQMHLDEGFQNAWWGVRVVYYFFSTLLVVVLVTGIAYTTVHLQKETRTMMGVMGRGLGRMFGYIRALEEESVREKVQGTPRVETPASAERPDSEERGE